MSQIWEAEENRGKNRKISMMINLLTPVCEW
jgi:hypothetical protein